MTKQQSRSAAWVGGMAATHQQGGAPLAQPVVNGLSGMLPPSAQVKRNEQR